MKLHNSRKTDLILLAVYFLLYLLLVPVLLAFAAESSTFFQKNSMAFYGRAGLITLLIFYVVKRKTLREDFAKFRERLGKNCRVVILAQLLIFLLNIPINLVLLHFGIHNQNQNTLGGLAEGGYIWFLVFLALFFAPVVEELVFRNILFNRFYGKSPVLAYIISILSFSMLHGAAALRGGKPQDFIAILSYVPLSFFLCRLYATRKSMAFPIALHFLNNSIAVILLLVLKTATGV